MFAKLRRAGRWLKQLVRRSPVNGESSHTSDARGDAAHGTDVSEPIAPRIDPADLLRMQELGRLHAIEPFEGWQHLEVVRKTMSSMERGLDWTLERGRGLRDRIKQRDSYQKAGTWFSKQKSKFDGEAGALSGAGRVAGSARDLAGQSYRDAGEWLRTSGMENIQQTLEYLLAHDPAFWVRKRAAKILGRSEFEAIRNSDQAYEAMRNLSQGEREQLITELYPYNLPGFAPYMKALDMTVNLGLGAVVATNIPGTGALVSLINMIKTIFKIAHRLHMMSTIHGYAIRDGNSLFVVSAKILQSLQGWEASQEHRPLDTNVLDDLYAGDEDEDASEQGFPALLNASLKKDLYISVPGVGTVGIGKIGLDDARLDYYVRAFVSGYFERRRLIEEFGSATVSDRSGEYAAIYTAFGRGDYFPVMRRRRKSESEATHRQEEDQKSRESGGVRAGVQRLFRRVSRGYTALAKDEFFEELSAELDRHAREIYLKLDDARRDSKSQPAGARWSEDDTLLVSEVQRILAG